MIALIIFGFVFTTLGILSTIGMIQAVKNDEIKQLEYRHENMVNSVRDVVVHIGTNIKRDRAEIEELRNYITEVQKFMGIIVMPPNTEVVFLDKPKPKVDTLKAVCDDLDRPMLEVVQEAERRAVEEFNNEYA